MEITNEQIKKVALEHGFTLKLQPNGEMDLHPYVYEFARALATLPDMNVHPYGLEFKEDLIAASNQKRHECPECGCKIFYDRSSALLTDPPQYAGTCCNITYYTSDLD